MNLNQNLYLCFFFKNVFIPSIGFYNITNFENLLTKGNGMTSINLFDLWDDITSNVTLNSSTGFLVSNPVKNAHETSLLSPVAEFNSLVFRPV